MDLSSHSGDICAGRISAQKLKCSASSGSVTLGAVSAVTLVCDTSSGSADLRGICAEEIAVTARSGNVKLAIDSASGATVRTSRGRVVLTLPENGAELLYHSGSGKFHTSRSYERKGDLYVFGVGESDLDVETSSGNLEIR